MRLEYLVKKIIHYGKFSMTGKSSGGTYPGCLCQGNLADSLITYVPLQSLGATLSLNEIHSVKSFKLRLSYKVSTFRTIHSEV